MDKFPPVESEVSFTKDSIIIVKDTVLIKGETIVIRDSIPCPPEVKYNKTIQKNNTSVTVKIDKGILEVDCKTDSLMSEIERRDHLITNTKINVKVHEVVKWQVRWYHTAAMWVSGILLVLTAGRIFQMIKK